MEKVHLSHEFFSGGGKTTCTPVPPGLEGTRVFGDFRGGHGLGRGTGWRGETWVDAGGPKIGEWGDTRVFSNFRGGFGSRSRKVSSLFTLVEEA